MLVIYVPYTIFEIISGPFRGAQTGTGDESAEFRAGRESS